MNDAIYKKLFDKDKDIDEINWIFHSTYNCDIAYSAELLMKQCHLENDIESAVRDANVNKFGVFYDKRGGLTASNQTAAKDWFIQKYFHPLTNENISFHAKISIVSYSTKSEQKYRIAVYSKNHSFGGNCMEVGQCFDLVVPKDNQNCEYTNEICAYLDKIYDATNEKGQEWLKNNELCKDGQAYKTLGTLVLKDAEHDRYVDLFFGGCGASSPLGKKMNISKLDFTQSVFITPPEFVKGTKLENFFKNNRCLYDLKNDNSNKTSSHEKVYLFKESDKDKYSFWFGSANATSRGLGVTYDSEWKPNNIQNVECLVRYKISPEEFTNLKNDINKDYAPFDFTKQGSLHKKELSFAQLIAENCTAKLVEITSNDKDINSVSKTNSYKNVIMTISISLLSDNNNLKEYTKKKGSLTIFPSGYSDEKLKDVDTLFWVKEIADTLCNKKQPYEIVINFKNNIIRDISGYLCLNNSVLMPLDVSQYNSLIQKFPPKYSDTRVSEWLLGKFTNDTELDKNDKLLGWFHEILEKGVSDESNK